MFSYFTSSALSNMSWQASGNPWQGPIPPGNPPRLLSVLLAILFIPEDTELEQGEEE